MEDFEKYLKNILEDGREEVPDGLWDAIEGRLPSGRRRGVPAWIWSIPAGMAVAAALTLAIVLPHSGPSSTVEIVPPTENTLAQRVDIQENAISPSQIFVPSSVANIPNIGQTIDPVTDKVVETEELVAEEEDEAKAEEKIAETAAKYSEEKPVEKTSPAQEGFFEGNEIPDESAPSRVSITVSGSGASNTNPLAKAASGGPLRAPAIPTKTGITETGESNYMIPLSFGVGVKFSLSKRWSLGVGVNVGYLQRKYAGTYRVFTDTEEILSKSFSDIKNRQIYIGIPVNAYYSIVNNRFVDFYAYAGGTVEKCIMNRHFMADAEGKYSLDSSLGGVCGSLGAGLGCEFIIAKTVGIYIDPSVRYYFSGTAPKSIRTRQPFQASIEVGLRVRL